MEWAPSSAPLSLGPSSNCLREDSVRTELSRHVLQCSLVSRNETDAIALAGKTMGDCAANPGGSAGDDDGAGGRFHATHRRLGGVEFVRSDRLGVDHRYMAVCRAIFATRLADSRQLQHGCSLSGAKVREKDDPAIGKLERIVVRCRVLGIHLPEAGNPSAGLPPLEKTKERSPPLDVIFKRELGAGQKADRYRRRIVGCEAAGRRARKARCYQIIAGFGCAR